MEKPKFTPGPWRVEEGTTLIWGCCNSEDNSSWGMGYPIVECRGTPLSSSWAKGPTDEENYANAALIAAAPDMYEALRALYDAVEISANRNGGNFGDNIGPAAYAALAALSKANGESGT